MNKICINFSLCVVCVFFFSCKGKNQTNQKATTQVVNGDSVKMIYDDNGKLLSKGIIHNGEYNGFVISYYDDGVPKNEGVILNNKRIGLWKEFDKNGTLEAAEHYDADSVLFKFDKSDFDFQQITSQYGFKISAPKTWVQKDKPEPPLLMEIYQSTDSFIHHPNLQIIADSINSNDLQGFCKNYITNFWKNNGAAIQLVYSRNVVINSKPSCQIGYKIIFKNQNLAGVATFIKNGNMMFVLSGMALNDGKIGFLRYKDLFEQIAATFIVI